MRNLHKAALVTAAMIAGSPAFAAGDGLLDDTNIVVSISFVLFIGVLIYFGVPKMVGKMLDDRAAGIKNEIDEARTLQEEAKTILASYERKRKEVAEQSEAIIASAKAEAQNAATAAKEALAETIERRLQAAKDQIVSAQDAAVREVKDKAVAVAIAAAGDVIASNMAAKDGNALIDAAIKDVGAKLH